MAEYMFPTETIDLPSQGKFYPEGHPLRSGKIDIKYMTAKEEDILTSTNLIQKGLVFDKLMESIVVTPGVKYDELIIGDLNAVMIASRILAYGKDYPITVQCPACLETIEHTVDLSKLEMIETDEVNDYGEFTYTLPSEVVVTYKLLTRADEKKIKAEVDALKKIGSGMGNSEGSTRLKYMITSINGNRDAKLIREFSEAMVIRDVRALRKEIQRVSPDINLELLVECNSCGVENKMRMPFGANFLWPEL